MLCCRLSCAASSAPSASYTPSWPYTSGLYLARTRCLAAAALPAAIASYLPAQPCSVRSPPYAGVWSPCADTTAPPTLCVVPACARACLLLRLADTATLAPSGRYCSRPRMRAPVLAAWWCPWHACFISPGARCTPPLPASRQRCWAVAACALSTACLPPVESSLGQAAR